MSLSIEALVGRRPVALGLIEDAIDMARAGPAERLGRAVPSGLVSHRAPVLGRRRSELIVVLAIDSR